MSDSESPTLDTVISEYATENESSSKYFFFFKKRKSLHF